MDRKEFIKNEINQDPSDPFNHYLLAIEYQKKSHFQIKHQKDINR